MYSCGPSGCPGNGDLNQLLSRDWELGVYVLWRSGSGPQSAGKLCCEVLLQGWRSENPSLPAHNQTLLSLLKNNTKPTKIQIQRNICLLSPNVRRCKSTLRAIHAFLTELLLASVQAESLNPEFSLLTHSSEQDTLRTEFQISAYGLLRNEHTGLDSFSVLQSTL